MPVRTVSGQVDLFDIDRGSFRIVIYNEGIAVFMAKQMIVLPITLEQLIPTIQQLQPSDRIQVAQALIQLELQSELKGLIEELYSQTPVDEITDSDIMDEDPNRT